MKKNSRKYRKLQKIHEQRKEMEAQIVKERQMNPKIRVCKHYIDNYYGERETLLYPISKEECRCKKCKTIYPITVYNKMQRYMNCNRYRTFFCEDITEQVIEETAKPIRYCHVEDGGIKYLDEPEYVLKGGIESKISRFRTVYVEVIEN